MKELENKINNSIFIEDTNCIIFEIKIGLTIINEILFVIEEKEKNKDEIIEELEKNIKILRNQINEKNNNLNESENKIKLNEEKIEELEQKINILNNQLNKKIKESENKIKLKEEINNNQINNIINNFKF